MRAPRDTRCQGRSKMHPLAPVENAPLWRRLEVGHLLAMGYRRGADLSAACSRKPTRCRPPCSSGCSHRAPQHDLSCRPTRPRCRHVAQSFRVRCAADDIGSDVDQTVMGRLSSGAGSRRDRVLSAARPDPSSAIGREKRLISDAVSMSPRTPAASCRATRSSNTARRH